MLTPPQITKIRKEYHCKSAKILAEEMGIKPSQVRGIVKRKGLKKNFPISLTSEERAYLASNYTTLPMKELEVNLGLQREKIWRLAIQMKLKRSQAAKNAERKEGKNEKNR